MRAAVFRQEEDGLWHIHCPECVMQGSTDWCAGKYSDREAALSNGAAHMRSKHGPNEESW